MLKALMPVAVYSIGVGLKKENFKSNTMANMIGISVEVAIAAYGEAKFNTWGVMLQLGAVGFEATRLVLIQILLTSKGITLNPITSLYYVAPCCLVFLTVPWLFVEFPLLKDNSTFHLDYVVFGTNSVCAFALNLAVFLLIGKTSALTMNVDNSALKQRIAALAQDKIFFKNAHCEALKKEVSRLRQLYHEQQQHLQKEMHASSTGAYDLQQQQLAVIILYIEMHLLYCFPLFVACE
ncbi:hypothetical protein KI387_007400, partial [Taxus chinensis]